MTATPKMDADLCKKIRAAVDAALLDVGACLGVSLKLGRAVFDPTSGTATFKLETAVIGADGAPKTREEAAFLSYGHFDGFKPEDLGRTFPSPHGELKIVGLATRARKQTVLCEYVGKGSRVWCDKRYVLRAIGRHDEVSHPAPKG